MDIEGLFFFIFVVFFPCFVPFAIILLYEIKIERFKNLWLSLLPFFINILALTYGFLRQTGKIIYNSDTPADILWSTWDFNGTLIIIACCSAFLGMLVYFIYRFIKGTRNSK